MMSNLRVMIWNEFVHERTKEEVRKLYPEGIHESLRSALQQLDDSLEVACATLDQSEHGLTEEVLAKTDVLLWWGHMAHDQVSEEVVARVQRRVLEGMGLIVLHSGHASKIFQRLMGTTCMLRWRDVGEIERLWIVSPGHPILNGITGDYIELPTAEMYGEHFDIPTPDELLLISWFEGGEVFRSGCTFRRGQGKIFYFRPGHETFPIYHHPQVQRIIANGVRWAAPPTRGNYSRDGRHIPEPLSPIARPQG
jgi:trehalose utilization protein